MWYTPNKSLFFLITLLGSLLIHNWAYSQKKILKYKNITYLKADSISHKPKQELNIFCPEKSSELKDVFVFIHGGSWKSGSKSGYNFLGKHMANKNVVCVIIDYPLIPLANYNEMAMDAALAVKWVKLHIEQYGGNSNKIFVSGHSAGGHLSALISVRDEYFDTIGIANPIKGAILIDAAGVNMYGYLKIEKFKPDHYFYKVFTSNEENWKKASPLYHLHQGMPPMLIYSGSKSYPSILNSNINLADTLRSYNAQPIFHVLKGKKHVQMMTQLFWSKNPLYNEITEFMNKQ